MTFDGSAYRRSVLATLRDRSPAEVEDLFWLASVPREAADGEVAEHLKATKGFLFKERTRARQAAVAQAVLAEWPRIEATLLDPGARAALLRRLGDAPAQEPAPAARPAAAPRGDRRRRQVSNALSELARLRDDPDLAIDLYAFLGLPTTATREMLAARIERIAEVNRRRRPDRERTLVDDLLAHARKLLLDGDPTAYLGGFADDAAEALLAGEATDTALAAARAHGVTEEEIVARVVDRTPAGELEARLRELPAWPAVKRRLDTLPPAPPRDVRVAIELNEALITWAASPDADGYLVERHASGGSRVLGRTPLLEFTDAAPREGGVTWSVRALRGASASSEPVTAGAPPSPIVDFTAEAARPVVLRWTAPAGARLVLKRTRGDVTRTISPDADGYVDRHVELGAPYEYTLAIDGDPASARSLTVTPKPSVSGLAARRLDDGRVTVTFTWPPGTTEVFVAWGPAPPTSTDVGRKITNTRYEIDGGATLDAVPSGSHLVVFTGTRSANGQLEWAVDAPASARTLVP